MWLDCEKSGHFFGYFFHGPIVGQLASQFGHNPSSLVLLPSTSYSGFLLGLYGIQNHVAWRDIVYKCTNL